MSRGFVKKRGDIWYAYWRDPSGKQRAKAIGTRKKDAEAYVTTKQSEVWDGTYRDIQTITFPKFSEQWVRDYATVQVKPSTLLNYKNMIFHSLVPYFGDVPLSFITTADIQRYVAERLASGRSPATVQKALVLLKGMLKQAGEWNYLKVNPALAVKAPRRQFIEMQALTPVEIPIFLDAFSPEWRSLFFTAIFTGMRLGELLALQWSDIDWKSGTIRVKRSVWNGTFQEPKTRNAIRVIGMSPMLTEVLREHLAVVPKSEAGLVFCTEAGKIIDGANLRHRIFEPALKAAGLRKIRIHDLRHTFASLLINQGENLKYVQNQLGHASITTTVDRYGHLMPDAHVDVGQRLDATVFPSVPNFYH
ncbi:MAG: site-specific integrase [Coriobacteriia bacterium]|nr:site-specific integrase [Coriobacteriia bacterium]